MVTTHGMDGQENLPNPAPPGTESIRDALDAGEEFKPRPLTPRETMDAAEAFAPPPDLLDKQLSALDASDTSNAKRFATRFGKDFVFLAPDGVWHHWNGQFWEADPLTVHIREKLMLAADAIYSEAIHIEDAKVKKSRLHWATKSKDKHRINGTLELAEVFLHKPSNLFDQKPLFFNTAGGTINLETGALLPHSQADLLTQRSPVPPNFKAGCPTWLKFLEDVFGCRWDDERDLLDDPLEGIQRLLGYTLTGLTIEQIMVCLHGGGSNGKSVLLEVVAYILGTYAAALRAEALMSKDRAASHQTDLVRLRGKRFVTTVESEDGHAFNESLIKQLTGGDTVSGREIFKATIEFKPEFTLWMASNHLPRIRGADHGIWRRIILIPFTQRFVDPEDAAPGDKLKDPALKAKLLAEAPAILAWMAHGTRMFIKDGLRVPRRWKDATQEYRSREDRLGAWMDECCERDPSAKTAMKSLLESFNQWATQEGEQTMTPHAFGPAISDRGFQRRKVHGMMFSFGLRLINPPASTSGWID